MGFNSAGAFLHAPTLLLLISTVFLVQGQFQTPTDSVSIDCGKSRGYNETYAATKFSYISDFQFIDTGETHKIAENLLSEYDIIYHDLRSFPDGNKNCYSIPVNQGMKYLVRAYFLYGNYDGLNDSPRFDLYLGVNRWSTVTNEANIYTILALVSSDLLSVCLVKTGSGTPFISGLDLRPLPDNLYKEVDPSQSLAPFYLFDAGSDKEYRYPDDQYDRFWQTASSSTWLPLNGSSTITTSNGYGTPSAVMSTAYTVTKGKHLDIFWNSTQLLGKPSNLYHIFMHFAELEVLNSSDSRIFDITLNGLIWSQGVRPTYLKTNSISSQDPKEYTQLSFSFNQTSASTLPPILNAMEIYNVIYKLEKETSNDDVYALRILKEKYKLQMGWTGDPCGPKNITWEGLTCTYKSEVPRIVSLELSNAGLTGEVPLSLSNLTQLQILDLSRNSLTGAVPDFLASLSNLRYLNLSGNNLSGSIPAGLLSRKAVGSLVLSLEDNPNLSTNTDSSKKSNKKTTIIITASVGSAMTLFVMSIIIWALMKRSRSHLGTKRNSGSLQKKPRGNSFRLSSICESIQFTYAELIMVTNNFATPIGKGGFGTVYYGKLENGIEVAVKMLSHLSSQGHKEFQTEAQLLSKIHHRNLVPLIGYCSNENHLALVYEYMSEGSLEKRLKGNDVLKWSERLRIAINAAQGLDYLHNGCKPAIVHRDVKASNILLNQDLEASIADFGLSKMFPNDDHTSIFTNVVGTPGYLDPEYYNTYKLNEKSDVYSFGVVLLGLITGLPAIVENKINIVNWVQERTVRNEMHEVVDKRLQGNYSMESVGKAIMIALECVASISIQRPDMGDVLSLLKECLLIESNQERSQSSSKVDMDTNSSNLAEMLPLEISSVVDPVTR